MFIFLILPTYLGTSLLNNQVKLSVNSSDASKFSYALRKLCRLDIKEYSLIVCLPCRYRIFKLAVKYYICVTQIGGERQSELLLLRPKTVFSQQETLIH